MQLNKIGFVCERKKFSTTKSQGWYLEVANETKTLVETSSENRVICIDLHLRQEIIKKRYKGRVLLVRFGVAEMVYIQGIGA